MKPLYKIRVFVPRRAIKVKSAICALITIGGVGTARAANCDAGYYLNAAGECVKCFTYVTDDVYCPGDDLRHDCPKADFATTTKYLDEKGYVLSKIGTHWNNANSSVALTDCFVNLDLFDKNGNAVYTQARYSISAQMFIPMVYYYTGAVSGFYLSGVIFTDPAGRYRYYSRALQCTNAPANAHYTGPGTPDIGDCPWECDEMPTNAHATNGECEWECDDGFGHTSDDRCLPLCRIGATAMNGINIYAEKHTKYAMAVPRGGATCWINATRDNGGKLQMVN
ncbi:MAG: hypothetical protein IJ560_00320 [Alphaproteobacteria bacterium]|nr:hypothetical protein [Alphaproteobacteria bacterium]